MTAADRASRSALAALLDDPALTALACRMVRRGRQLDRVLAATAGVSRGYVAKVLRQRGLRIEGAKLIPVETDVRHPCSP